MVIPVTGTRIARFVALSVMCLVVATATAQAQSNTVGFVPTITPTLNTVKVSFTTPVPTSASVSTSVDKSFALTVLDTRAKKVHNITIRALAPATTYNIKVVATRVKGKPSVFVGSFPTGAIGSVPATVTTVNGKLLMNGVPFFLKMSLGFPCISSTFVDKNIAMGINTVDNATGCSNDQSTWSTYLQSVMGTKLWMTERDPRLAQAVSGLPNQFQWPSGGLLENGAPSVGSCNTPNDDKSINSYYNQLKIEASKKPVIFQADISNPWAGGQQNCYDKPSMQAMLLLAVTAGIQGFEFQSFLRTNSQAGFSVKEPELSDAVKSVNGQLDTLQPAVLSGKTILLSTSRNSPVKFGAWQYGGVSYIIAVNTMNASITTTFTVPQAKSKTAQGLWGSRSLKVSRGTISSSFEPLEVHFYKLLPPAPIKK